MTDLVICSFEREMIPERAADMIDCDRSCQLPSTLSRSLLFATAILTMSADDWSAGILPALEFESTSDLVSRPKFQGRQDAGAPDVGGRTLIFQGPARCRRSSVVRIAD
jgi:hypothetical protein